MNKINFISGGTTLQSGLNMKFGSTYRPLNDETMAKIRKNYEGLEALIIDELSMVGCDSFYGINRRLQGDSDKTGHPFLSAWVKFFKNIFRSVK